MPIAIQSIAHVSAGGDMSVVPHIAPHLDQAVLAVVVAEPGPVQQQVPQQLPASIPGAAAGASMVVVMICGFCIWYWVKHKKARASHITVSFIAGVMLATTAIGGMAAATSLSLGGTVMQLMTNLGADHGGTGTGTGTGGANYPTGTTTGTFGQP